MHHNMKTTDKLYYENKIAEYEQKLAHFRHAEGPGTGLFQG